MQKLDNKTIAIIGMTIIGVTAMIAQVPESSTIAVGALTGISGFTALKLAEKGS